MDIHLVLKQDPSFDRSPIFVRSSESRIGFSKFQTQFEFKTVSLPEDDVFGKVANPLIQNKFLKDNDVLLLTLGPTNSGKSHILFHNNDSIVNQSLQTIFDNTESYSGNIELIRRHYPEIVDSRQMNEIDSQSSNFFSVSMFELYNDTVIDLLSKDPRKQKGNCDIITDPIDHKLSPRNITKVLVNSYDSAHQLIYEGYAKRKTCPTFANNLSSRSHCFLFLNIHKLYSNQLKTSRFTIVDLAGLERSKSSRTSGLTLREASHTNGSLTELGRCLELISMNQFHRTCLRTNKLTRLVLNDFVKNQNPVSILTTLDPFGEAGLILQTLRYIDPIKHQVLQRRSLLASKTRNTSSSTTFNSELTGEIDSLRRSQKTLKEKITALENCIVETENRVRREMYNESENNIATLIIKHKEEIDKLEEINLAQADQKLQDQAELFNQQLSDLKVKLKVKSEALDASKLQLHQTELELEDMTQRYNSLSLSLKEKQDLRQSIYLKLEKQFEETCIQNEALNIEINTLQLSLKEAENSYEQSIRHLKEDHQESLMSFQLQLDQSNINIEDMERKITSFTEIIEQKDNELKDIKGNYESANASLVGLKESLLHFEVKENQLLLVKEKLEKELEECSQKLIHTTEEYDIAIAAANANVDRLKEQLQMKENESEQNNKVFATKLESLKLELHETQTEKLRLEDEVNALLIKIETVTNEINGLIVIKDSEINLFKKTAQQQILEAENSIAMLKIQNENLQKEFENNVKEHEKVNHELSTKQEEILSLQEKVKNHDSIQIRVVELEKQLKQEIETNRVLHGKVETLEKSKFELPINEKILNPLLDQKQKMLQDLTDAQKEVNQKSVEIEQLNTNLSKEVSKVQKLTTKYASLKAKSCEIAGKIVSVEEEKMKLRGELDAKNKKLLDAEKKINHLTLRFGVSGENNSKVGYSSDTTPATVAKSPQSENTLHGLQSILDTNPLDDVGLPLILSSPLKSSSFQIHSDSIEKDNTITFPVVDKKKRNSLKKLSKKDKLEKQMEMQEKMMLESSATPKIEKKKFKVLTNTKLSELNKLNSEVESVDKGKHLKRRKSSSPLKPAKRKLRKSLGPSDSMELLN